MVLNSLLREQPDGSFYWSTDRIEVRLYHEVVTALSDGYDLDLGWSGYVWPAGANPWIDNYLYHTAGRGSLAEAIFAVEEVLKRLMPGALKEPSGLLENLRRRPILA